MKIIDELKQYNVKEWLYLLLIIAVVVTIGLVGINQYLSYRFKAELLSTPCDLCRTLNPQFEECFHKIIEGGGSVAVPINYSKVGSYFNTSNP